MRHVFAGLAASESAGGPALRLSRAAIERLTAARWPYSAADRQLVDGSAVGDVVQKDPGRFASYCKLRRELAYLDSLEDPRLQRERKERMLKLIRPHVKEHRRRRRLEG